MLVTADRVFGGHLYVRNGKIAAISDDGTLPAREELDAAGLYVLPGMLDCHAHINDPGFTWREDLPHASEAAAVDFVRATGKEAIITSPENVRAAVVEGKGTHIVP